MRVALVVLEEFPGSENRVQRQALALRDSGHEVRVLAARGDVRTGEWEGIRVDRTLVGRRKAGSMKRRLWEYVAFTLEAWMWCRKLAREWQPHAVQFASMPDWLVFCGRPCRVRCDSRLLLDLHELMPELLDAKGSRPALRRWLVWLERASVKYADELMVPTEMCAEILSRRIPDRAAAVVLNGVDLRRFSVSPTPRSSGAEPVIGYHGTLAERFGLETVIRACAALADAGPGEEWQLTLIGDGTARAALQTLAADLGIDERVRFLGQRPSNEIPGLASGFDVAVVPYNDSEFMRLAYPTKAFEYGALGVPMLCSDLPSIRRLFGPEEVLFVPPGDPQAWAEALQWTMANPGPTTARARAARVRTIKDYSWDTWQHTYVEVVERAPATETRSI